MKTLLAILAALAIGIPASGQTNTNTPTVVITNEVPVISGPARSVIDFLLSSSNLMVAPYCIYTEDGKTGGGIGLLYKFGDFVGAGLRVDYLDGNIWMPSGNFQLQAPMRIGGKVEVVPFVFGGLATPLSGRDNANMSAVGVGGIGMAFRISKSLDIVYDYEKWTGFPANQHRFGFIWKF